MWQHFEERLRQTAFTQPWAAVGRSVGLLKDQHWGFLARFLQQQQPQSSELARNVHAFTPPALTKLRPGLGPHCLLWLDCIALVTPSQFGFDLLCLVWPALASLIQANLTHFLYVFNVLDTFSIGYCLKNVLEMLPFRFGDWGSLFCFFTLSPATNLLALLYLAWLPLPFPLANWWN